MRVLFVHQNFPGQYKHLAPALAGRPGHEVVALTINECPPIPGVRVIRYTPKRGTTPGVHPWVAELVAQDRLEEPAYVSPAGPIAPLDILYGHRPQIAAGNTYMAHRTGFTARTLGQALVRAGFARAMVQRDGFELWAVAYCREQPSEVIASEVRLRDALPAAVPSHS